MEEREVEDLLVYRYNILEGADTGFRGREGTFTACAFWNVECLARARDLKMARFYFEAHSSSADLSQLAGRGGDDRCYHQNAG